MDEQITIQQLTLDPYTVYKRLRAEAPVLRVKAVGRTLLTKAADTKYVKDNPVLFSSNDPNTPMQRAFRAHTLMRKDGAEHAAERGAMAPAFTARNIKQCWEPIYTRIAEDYVGRLPRGETLIFGRSHCDVCQRSLGMADLVPVLSFIISRGRCRYCAAPIKLHLLLVELASLAMALSLCA
ncbi:MAG: hypothetical protein B7X55_04530, partial [Rhodobacterales bacterium 34-62-10]